MPEDFRDRSWLKKFRDAFWGMRIGMAGQSSFRVHLPVALLVVVAAGILRMGLAQWCLLLLCITIVLAAELFNSALESLAKAIDPEYNIHLADGLDIASGAVLVTALGAAVVGTLLFLFRVVELLGS